MKCILWTDDLSVGNDILDSEHMLLFNIYNDLLVELSRAEELGCHHVSASVVDRICDYINTHFEHEEEVMRICNYPGFDAHVAQHEVIISKVILFKRDYTNYILCDAALCLIEFLGNWLFEHIKTSDRKYSEYIKQ